MALVTGANKGLGPETVRRLAGKGWLVFLAVCLSCLSWMALGDTDLNNHTGNHTVAEGAEAVIRLATLDPDGPIGGFFDRNGFVPW